MESGSVLVGDVADEIEADLVLVSSEAVHAKHVDANLLAGECALTILVLPSFLCQPPPRWLCSGVFESLIVEWSAAPTLLKGSDCSVACRPVCLTWCHLSFPPPFLDARRVRTVPHTPVAVDPSSQQQAGMVCVLPDSFLGRAVPTVCFCCCRLLVEQAPGCVHGLCCCLVCAESVCVSVPSAATPQLFMLCPQLLFIWAHS